MGKTKVNSELLATREVRSSNDYDQFKTLPGNRKVSRIHVNELIKLMMKNGNLTDQFPIIISKDYFVIDGQHRLEALRVLGWDVGYVVEEAATIDTVRAINRGQRNWTWRDIAFSYADLGDDGYSWFVSFVDNFGLKFNPALAIVRGENSKGATKTTFAQGELVVEDKERCVRMATQLNDLAAASGLTSGDFLLSAITVMRSPAYNHERMVHKVEELGHTLPQRARQTEYMRLLEDIFNHKLNEENRVRLF